MVETRNFNNNKVLTDFDPSALPNDSLEDAFNIKIDNGIEGNFGVVTDIKGNRLVSYALRAGVYDFVGGGWDAVLNKNWAFFEHDGGYHIVLEFDKSTETITKIMEDLTDTNSIPTLNISKLTPFTGFDIIEIESKKDILGLNPNIFLSWVDARTEPRCMYPDMHKVVTLNVSVTTASTNIVTGVFDKSLLGRFISINNSTWKRIIAIGATTITVDSAFVFSGTFTSAKISYKGVINKDDLLIAKTVPLTPIKASYLDDTTINYNRVKGLFFQFVYQYIYESGEDSAWSTYSNVATPPVDTDPTSKLDSNKSNAIDLELKTGGKGVVAINVGFRFRGSTNNGFYLIESIDKRKLGLLDNVSHTIRFKNDKEIIPLAISEFANRLYDNIPFRAGAQTVVNGNQICYGDVDLNLNGTDIDMDFAVTYSGEQFKLGLLNISFPFNDPTLKLSGVVGVGDKVTVKVMVSYKDIYSDYYYYDTQYHSYVATSTVLTEFAQGLQDACLGYSTPIDTSNPDFIYISVYNGAAQLEDLAFTYEPQGNFKLKSLHSFKYSSSQYFGVVYGDDKGRVSGVSKAKNPVVIGDYRDHINELPIVEWSIKSRPPAFATWWSLVRTDNLTYSRAIQLKGEDFKTLTTDTTFLTLSLKSLLNQKVTDFSKSNVAYDYAKGDRIKVIYDLTAKAPFNIPIDTEIISYTITETDIIVKIKNPLGLAISGLPVVLVELYTPYFSSQNNSFFEIGEVYPIINPGTDFRAHQGQTQSQDVINISTVPAKGKTSEGDSFLRLADNRFTYDKGTGSSFYINIEDFSFSDYYGSKCKSNGRAFIEDDTINRTRYKSKILFTDPIIPGYRSNGSNKIYAGNVFDDLFDSKGAVKVLTVRGDYLIAIQDTGCCAVPVYNTMIEVGTEALQIGLSRKLLNRPRYYTGEYGIENAVRSFTIKDNYIYFACPSKGSLVRLAFDGLTQITDVTFTNFKLNDLIKINGVSNNIIGAFDEEYKQYVIHFKSTGDTWAFDEDLKGFECRYAYKPDGMISMGKTFVSFKNGQLYIHDNLATRNNFYGEQFDSSLTFLINSSPEIKKIFLNGSINSDGGWYIEKLQTSLGGESQMFIGDFEQLEGIYYSEFPMDGLSDGSLLNGDPLRGNWIRVFMKKVGNVKQILKSVSVAMISSGKNLV